MKYSAWVVLAIVTLGAIVGKATLGSFIQVWGIKPDMSLVVVAIVGFSLGSRFGVAMGLVVGLLQDGMFGGQVGLQALVHATAGLVGGLAERRMSGEHHLSPFILGASAGLAAESVALLLINLMGGHIPVLRAICRVIMPESVYDGVFAVLIFGPVYSLSHAIRPKLPDSAFIGRLP